MGLLDDGEEQRESVCVRKERYRGRLGGLLNYEQQGYSDSVLFGPRELYCNRGSSSLGSS